MAKFLTREEIVRTTDRIIEEAKRELILISPFIKPDDETKDLLKDKRRATEIHVIYGKKELNPKERSFLDSLGIKPSFRKNLHAKCYLNENEALLTSMNLYQFSQEHNDEMGILVSNEDDVQLYKDIYRQAKRWIASSSEAKTTKNVGKASVARKSVSTRKRRATTPTLERPYTGYCIRCGVIMSEVKESNPFCSKDWRTWNRFKNDEYPEEFCHFCGKESETSKSRPLCIDCYRKYKSILEL